MLVHEAEPDLVEFLLRRQTLLLFLLFGLWVFLQNHHHSLGYVSLLRNVIKQKSTYMIVQCNVHIQV